MSTEKEVDLISKVLLEVVSHQRNNDYAAAFSHLNEYLAGKLTQEQREEFVAYRAFLKEESRDYQGATKDLLEALSLSPKGSYKQYVNEFCLGNIKRKQRKYDEAAEWYLKSLSTCARSDVIAGGSALISFLELKGKNGITEKEKRLCERVVRKSWDVLCIPGKPDLSDLKKLAGFLIQKAAHPGPEFCTRHLKKPRRIRREKAL